MDCSCGSRGIVYVADIDASPKIKDVATAYPPTAQMLSFQINRTSKGMPLRSSRTSVIASDGHWLVHTPHPMHFSQLSVDVLSIDKALKGQASTQVPQDEHRCSSILTTYPEEAIMGLPYLTIASMPPQQHLQQLHMQ